MVISNDKLRHQFSARLNTACDSAGLPPVGQGRASIIAREIALRTKKVSLNGVSKWLSGDSIPTHANVTALADMLGVRPEWLQFGDAPRANLIAPPHYGPFTRRLAAKLANLEAAGRLNQQLAAALDAILDAAR